TRRPVCCTAKTLLGRVLDFDRDGTARKRPPVVAGSLPFVLQRCLPEPVPESGPALRMEDVLPVGELAFVAKGNWYGMSGPVLGFQSRPRCACSSGPPGVPHHGTVLVTLPQQPKKPLSPSDLDANTYIVTMQKTHPPRTGGGRLDPQGRLHRLAVLAVAGRVCDYAAEFPELFRCLAGKHGSDTGDLSAEQIWGGAEPPVERLTEFLRSLPCYGAERALDSQLPKLPKPGVSATEIRLATCTAASPTPSTASPTRPLSTASRTAWSSAGRGRARRLTVWEPSSVSGPACAKATRSWSCSLNEPFEGGIKIRGVDGCCLVSGTAILNLSHGERTNPNIRLTVACKDRPDQHVQLWADLQQHKQQQGRANQQPRQQQQQGSKQQGSFNFSALVSALQQQQPVQQAASPARNQPTAEHESQRLLNSLLAEWDWPVPAIDFQVYGDVCSAVVRFPNGFVMEGQPMRSRPEAKLDVVSPAPCPKPVAQLSYCAPFYTRCLSKPAAAAASDTAEAAAAAECRGQRVPHEIRIASVTPQALAAMAEQPPESQPSTEPKPPALSAAPRPDARMLHLMKDTGDWGSARPSVLVMLAVPAHMTVIDLAQFVADSGSELLEMKIIRDRSPGQFMVLLQFTDQAAADQFYSAKHGEPFSSLEPELTCCLAYVARVETRSRGAQFPVRELVELPTCPVCLDRLDEPLKGILTILCNHSFHLRCLDKWHEASCPSSDGNSCSLCGDTDSLWICLICGYVGCGRYTGGHAYEHFRSTSHTFAMEVARTGSGTTAATTSSTGWCRTRPTANSCRSAATYRDDKLDAGDAGLESQRLYYEEQLEQQAANLRETALQAEQEREQRLRTMAELEEARRERAALDKRLGQTNSRLQKLQKELDEERGFNSGMLANQRDLQERLQAEEARRVAELRKKEEELEQLREEMRDLYAHLEAGQQLAGQLTQDEAVGSQLVVVSSRSRVPAVPSPPRRGAAGTAARMRTTRPLRALLGSPLAKLQLGGLAEAAAEMRRLQAALDAPSKPRPARRGGPRGHQRHCSVNKKVAPRQRLRMLFDGGKFCEINRLAGHGMPYGTVPAAGSITAFGRISDRLCIAAANDATVKGGTLYPIGVKKMLRLQELSGTCRIPIVYLVDSGGPSLPLQ
uniref:RING-type domain-containing protein n=1 Tax=Macrostomum lignano TaxID=282301 RepID=A0A1I8F5P7_9PLAT